jgi:hypothetical protein
MFSAQGSGIWPVPGGNNSSSGGGIPEAPIDGKTYGRKDGAWAEATSAGSVSYTHTQSTAAATWNIQHNLGKREVCVLIFDSGGDQIIGDIDWSSSTINLLVVQFSEPLTGTAYIKF